jgi:RimJ/RimL family protein N-acetyltransferase
MIRGEKIHLRLFHEKDLEFLTEAFHDLEKRGDYFPLDLMSGETFRKKFQEDGCWSDTFGRMVVCDPEGNIVGGIWFFTAAPYMDGYEIGYIVFSDKDRGKGYMTEALTLFTEYLFNTKKINRLQLGIHPDNASSKKVAEKCGYRLEGIMRGSIFLHGKNHDTELYSRLRGDGG